MIQGSFHRIAQGICAILFNQRNNPLIAHVGAGILRLYIQQAAFRITCILNNHILHITHDLIIAIEQYRRNANAFAINIPGIERVTTWRLPTDIVPVPARHHKRDDFIFKKYGTCDLDIWLVISPSEVCIITDDHITGTQILAADCLDRNFSGDDCRAEHRWNIVALRDELHLGIKHRGRGIRTQVHDGARSRSHHGNFHFPRNRIERIAQNFIHNSFHDFPRARCADCRSHRYGLSDPL